jgi:hypothetical protein
MSDSLPYRLHDGLARTLERHPIGVDRTIARRRLRESQYELKQVNVDLR